MHSDTWWAFFIACWLISLSPGAGAVASMSSGLRHGFRHGYWNVIGLQLGLAGQVAIVAAGVGALLVASEMAFAAVKWFGVGYLAFLAVKQWRQGASAIVTETPSARALSPRTLVVRGFLVNISNPKALVFMLAVLPQFFNPQLPLLPQYLLMGLTMIVVDMVVMAGYTGLAAKILLLLKTPCQQRLINRSFAALFLGAASVLCFVNRQQ